MTVIDWNIIEINSIIDNRNKNKEIEDINNNIQWEINIDPIILI